MIQKNITLLIWICNEAFESQRKQWMLQCLQNDVLKNVKYCIWLYIGAVTLKL